MTEELRQKLRKLLLEAIVQPERVLDEVYGGLLMLEPWQSTRAKTRGLADAFQFVELTIADAAWHAEARLVPIAERVHAALMAESGLSREAMIEVLALVMSRAFAAPSDPWPAHGRHEG